MNLNNQLKCTINGTEQRRINIPNETLPSGYTRLQYIENTSTASINTGLTPARYDVIADLDIDTSNGDQCIVMGAHGGNDTAIFGYCIPKDGKNKHVIVLKNWAQRNTINLSSAISGKIHYSLKWNSNTSATLNINGTSYTQITTETEIYTENNVYINAQSVSKNVTTMKIYKFDILLNGSYVRKFVPCRNSSDVAGLYDLVNGVFYPSSNASVAYICGPDRSALLWRATDRIDTIEGQSVQQVLPSGYTQLNYITSAGSSYIDTGFKANTTKVTFEGTFEPTEINSTNRVLFGSRNNSTVDSSSCNVWLIGSESKFRLDWINGNSTYIFSSTISAGTKYTLNISRGYGTINGEEYTDSNEDSIDQDGNFLIGTMTDGESARSSCFIGNIYECKVYTENSIWHDYIPCKNSSNVCGMYDIIDGVFYPSASSTAFTAGTVYQPTPDTPVEVMSCGDKIKNLIDPSLSYGRLYISAGTPTIRNADSGQCIQPILLEPNTTYTINKMLTSRFIVGLSVGIANGDSGYRVNADATKTSVTFTTDSTNLYLTCLFRNDTDDADIPIQTIYNTIQLVKGDKVIPYLPYSGYERLEYIESNGNQYLDTGKASADFDNLEFTYAYTDYSGEWPTLLGAWNTADNSQRLVLQKNVSSNYYSLCVGNTSAFTSVALDTNKHTFTYNSTTGVSAIDDTTANTGSSTFAITMALCALKSDSAVEYLSKARIYGFKLTKNSIPVMDLIPVKNSSGVAGMYDIISRTFYSSSTATAFIAGPATEHCTIRICNKGTNLAFGFTKGIGLHTTTGAETSAPTAWTSDYIPVNFNTSTNNQYTLSHNINGQSYLLWGYNKNKKAVHRTSGGSITPTRVLSKETFASGTADTLDTEIAYVRITFYDHAGATGGITLDNTGRCQLEDGGSATDYVPYHAPVYHTLTLDEPLRKINETADEIKITRANSTYTTTLTRKIGKHQMLGNEDLYGFSLHDGSTYFTANYRAGVETASSSKVIEAMSNKLIGATMTQTWNGTVLNGISAASNGTYVQFCLPQTVGTSLNDFITWLNSQRPTIYYRLGTQTTETLTWGNNVPKMKDKEIWYIDTELQPSSIEVA